MSLEHALRFGGGENHFHRGYSDGFSFEAQQYAHTFQNDNFGVNLNQLLAGVHEDPLVQYPQQRRGLFPAAQPLMDLQTYTSPSHRVGAQGLGGAHAHYSPAPSAPPNSTFQSPALSQSCGLPCPPQHRNAPSSSRSLLSSFSSLPQYDSSLSSSSQLGLEDILQRLEGLSHNLPSSSSLPLAQPQQQQQHPQQQQQPSCHNYSRGSTPLSWNPLGALSATPLSSLTPSPTLLPTPQPQARPLMEDYHAQQFEEEPKLVAQNLNAHAQHQHHIRGIAKLPGPEVASGARTSWSQIVRSSSTSRLPPPQTSPPSGNNALGVSHALVSNGHHAPLGQHALASNSQHAAPLDRALAASPASPPPGACSSQANAVANGSSQAQAPSNGLPDYHRGPKVDPRWPVQQQVFLGPIPMSISWDEIRNVFYTKVSRKELLHFYVQSKPVNEVVYGQVVFDKVSLANKILKEGPIKVRGQYITMTSMAEKMKQMKLEKKNPCNVPIISL